MDRPEKIAFETTKEIVVARMNNAQHKLSTESGELVGEYFEAIYNKLLEISKSNND